MFTKLNIKIAIGVLIILLLVLGFLWNQTPSTLAPVAREESANLELIHAGFDYPVNTASPNDGTKRIFVVEHHTGKIRVIQDGRLLNDDFIDIGDLLVEEKDHETGVQSIAFPPDFPRQKHFYVTYTDREKRFILSRFQISEDTSKAIKSSEEIILKTDPFLIPNHHCGHITFGPKDKYLYICIGDGRSPNTSQDLGNLRGSILRLDVEGPGKPSSIPPDNPFVSSKGKRPEIWAYGLRNPWKFAFDPATGDMFIPDVGEDDREELNLLRSSDKGGGNFGWPFLEGNTCKENCEDNDFKKPFFDYPYGHLAGHFNCAIIGGAVYRGNRFPQWQGMYFFSDHCSGMIWAIKDIHGSPEIRYLKHEPLVKPNSISADYDGEIILVNSEGNLWRLHLPASIGKNWESVSNAVEKWRRHDKK